MPLMTNAEAFRYDFGIYATELWAMTEEQFLEWLNAWCDREKPADMVVRCKDCIHRFVDGENVRFNVCELNHNKVQGDDWFCADGVREEKDDE